MRSDLVRGWKRWQVEATSLMGDIEIHTAKGWVKLDDMIQGQETCTVCLAVEGAEQQTQQSRTRGRIRRIYSRRVMRGALLRT